MASGQRSVIRNRSGLKKDRSKSGSSLFSCTKGHQNEAFDNLQHDLWLEKLENDELKKKNKEQEDLIKTLTEKMEKTVILQHCNNVNCGEGVFMVEETEDSKKLEIYMETIINTLKSEADDKNMLEIEVRRLKETLDNVQKKTDLIEFHFGGLNETLTREFKEADDQLMQYNLDIANQFRDMRKIFQRAQDSKIEEPVDGEDARKIEAGINAIQDWVSPTCDVTASTLPIPARKLHKMLTTKYGKMPVKLEKLFTSCSKGYYKSSDTFANNVARWLVGWVRSSAQNTSDVLQRELANLNKVLDIVSDSED